MVTLDQINAIALNAFLDRNPWLQAALGALTDNDAKSRGLNIKEYRMQRIEESIAREAEEIGLHPLDYKLQLAELSGLDIWSIRNCNN